VRADQREQFIGLIEWDGTPPDLDGILERHFEGDQFSYFIAVHFGENRTINLDIMNDLGFRCCVFRAIDDNRQERIRVQGSTIKVVNRPILGSVATMMIKHPEEVDKIVRLFMEHDHGFETTIRRFIESDLLMVAEREIEKISRDLPRPKESLHWCGEIINCDLCERSFVPLRYMIDAHLPSGGGANVCAKCFLEFGGTLGTGRGQLYEATEDGWLYIAG
jgi:hypothetical protein